MSKKLISSVIASVLLLLACQNNKNTTAEIVLDSPWKINSLDSPQFSTLNYNDNKWQEIVQEKFLDGQGYADYDGVIWYRYKVVISSSLKASNKINKIQFNFGKIDDNDQFYLNGFLIGGNGQVGDTIINNSKSFHQTIRRYELAINDKRILWDKENVIALRVVDLGGKLGMSSPAYIVASELPLNYSLDKNWHFKPGDSLKFSEKNYDDVSWAKITPGKEWEIQGFSNYDGFGWYRLRFTLPTNFVKGLSLDARLQLNLGKVDDYDQVYLNGHLIGENNSIDTLRKIFDDSFIRKNTFSDTFRQYILNINDQGLRGDSVNLLAVRVFDSGGEGGLKGIVPYLRIITEDEDLIVDYSKFLTINNANKLDTVICIKNTNKHKIFSGSINYSFQKKLTKQHFIGKTEDLLIKPQDSAVVKIKVPQTTDELNFSLQIRNSSQINIIMEKRVVPFVLKN